MSPAKCAEKHRNTCNGTNVSGFSVKGKLKTSLIIKDGKEFLENFPLKCTKRFLENSY
jgi:hypothetical protein